MYRDADANCYVAWVGEGIRLGTCPTPSQAAQVVVNWYKETYGDRWRDVLANRKRKSIIISAKNRGRGGWFGAVYLFGTRVDIARKHGDKILTAYPTRPAVEEAINEFLAKVLGPMFLLTRRVFLYRLGQDDENTKTVYSLEVEPDASKKQSRKRAVPCVCHVRSIEELISTDSNEQS